MIREFFWGGGVGGACGVCVIVRGEHVEQVWKIRGVCGGGAQGGALRQSVCGYCFRVWGMKSEEVEGDECSLLVL